MTKRTFSDGSSFEVLADGSIEMIDAVRPLLEYDPSQPRDEAGRWTSGGGGGGRMFVRSIEVTPRDYADYKSVMTMTAPEMADVLSRVGLTPEAARQKIEEVRTAIAGSTPTVAKYLRADGTWEPERDRLHEALADELVAGIPSSDFPHVILTGGLPGSGKSSMLASGLYADIKGKYVKLDSDIIKDRLAQADGLKRVGWRAQLYHEEADDVIGRVLGKAIAGRKNILFDGTMKTGGKVAAIIDGFKRAGYTTEIAFAKLPMRKAMGRALERFYRGGRFVDPAYIASHNAKGLRNVETLRVKVDRWRIWNTDVPRGASAILDSEG